MSLAACIRASSVGDLIMRCARTIGLALTIGTPGNCCLSRSSIKKRLVSSKATGCPATFPLAQKVRDKLERLLVFLPGADLGRDLEHLFDARVFEEGRHDDRLALGRDGDSGQALAPPPADAGVIVEAWPGSTNTLRCRVHASIPCLDHLPCVRRVIGGGKDHWQLPRRLRPRRPNRTRQRWRRARPRPPMMARRLRRSRIVGTLPATRPMLHSMGEMGQQPLMFDPWLMRRETPRHARDDGDARRADGA